jgi:hypothetical protein
MISKFIEKTCFLAQIFTDVNSLMSYSLVLCLKCKKA